MTKYLRYTRMDSAQEATGGVGKNNVLLFPAPARLEPGRRRGIRVENALAAYSGTTAAPHEYFYQTGFRREPSFLRLPSNAVGNGCRSVVAADFNGDGNTDIAAAYGTAGTVSSPNI